MLPSLINLFAAPFSVRTARTSAKKDGALDFFHQGIAVYCGEEHVDLVKTALDRLVEFYGTDWLLRRKNLRCIVIDRIMCTALWFSVRTLVINREDAGRMTSINHMAGWLAADMERIAFLRRKHALHMIWSARLLQEANAVGRVKRDEFIRRCGDRTA